MEELWNAISIVSRRTTKTRKSKRKNGKGETYSWWENGIGTRSGGGMEVIGAGRLSRKPYVAGDRWGYRRVLVVAKNGLNIIRWWADVSVRYYDHQYGSYRIRRQQLGWACSSDRTLVWLDVWDLFPFPCFFLPVKDRTPALFTCDELCLNLRK